MAQNPASLAGKVLRVSDVGTTLAGRSPVFTQGHHTVAGLCADPSTGTDFESEPGPAAAGAAGAVGLPDEINLLTVGADYGWPAVVAASRAPLATLTGRQAGAAGCAVTAGVLYVASRDGQSLLAATITRSTLSVTLSAFTASLTGAYGRLSTVAASPDGSLWLATSNKDGAGTPIVADERILHIQPDSGGASSPL